MTTTNTPSAEADEQPAPFRVRVNGTPVQQGSKNATVRGDKAVMYEAAGDRLRRWRYAVATVAASERLAARHQTFHGPVIVEAVFSMPRPASGEGARRLYPSVAPDLDKLTRAIGDALTTAGVYADDGQVIRWVVTELYAGGPNLFIDHISVVVVAADQPGVTITVTPLSEPKEIPAPKAYVPRQARPSARRPTPMGVESLRTARKRSAKWR